MRRRWRSGAIAVLLVGGWLTACHKPSPGPPVCALTECDGACVDVQVDGAHCGACGHACQAGEVCSAGVCRETCEAPLAACLLSGSVRCVAVMTDSANCGACGVNCSPQEVCASGTCSLSCSSPFSACGGGEGAWCADLAVDRQNCGACGRACPVGQSCNSGACTPGCEGPGLASCGDACVDFFSDDRHCGGCGTVCSTTERCDRAVCRDRCVLEGRSRCGALCVDLGHDESNCGACGKSCPAGGVCRDGLCQGPVCAGGPFLPGRPDISDSVLAKQLLAGDFDGDGRVDLLLPEYFGSRIQLVHGLDGGGFGAPFDAIASAGVPLVAADLDGDGDQDVLVGGAGNVFATYLNDGSGHFRLGPSETSYGYIGALVEDLDGDGRPDVLAYSMSSVKVWFASGTQSSIGSFQLYNLAAVRAADLDGDGRLDLVVGTNGGFAPMAVLKNQGGGVFGPQQVVLGQIPEVFALRVADLDGDGLPEAVAMGYDALEIFQNVDGALVLGAKIPLPEVLYRYDLLVADLDGDARPEVVVGEVNGFRVFPNKGDGTFGPDALVPASPAQALAAIDVDHDGQIDLVAASAPAGGVEVRRRLPSGGFEGPERLPIAADRVLLADLDRDGRADLVTLKTSSSGPPTGTLEVRLSGAPGAPPRSMTGLGWSGVQSGDLDGDGDLDLVLASADGPGVLLNRGDGSFEPEVPVIGVPPGAALGDVDGNGALDLVAIDASRYPRQLSVALGLRNGAFRAPVKTPAQAGTWAPLALGDVDGDGRADAVLLDDAPPVLRVYLGRSDATFAPGVEVPVTPSYRRELAVRDLDGDGRAEIVALLTDLDSEALVVVRGSALPLAPPELTALSGGHSGMAIASLLGGARAQVVLESSRSIGVLVGQADGGFAPEVRWAAPSVSSLAVGDVDGDLRDDVAVRTVDALLLFRNTCPAR